MDYSDHSDHSDHSGMSMSSMVMSGTATVSAAIASSTTAASEMAGMSHGGNCKISMLWNWYTVDSCFIASSWHVTSKGMFAGSCIGVILLVLSLEFLRRAGKEYDRYIIARYNESLTSTPFSSVSSATGVLKGASASASPAPCNALAAKRFRPTVLQQAIRALLHMLQFAVAYFVMLLAMYFNGYIIISIFIGAFLGFFAFGWESFAIGLGGSDRRQEETTVCCG